MTLTTTDADGNIRMRWQTFAAVAGFIAMTAFGISQVYGRLVSVETGLASFKAEIIARMDRSDAKQDRVMAAFGLNGSSTAFTRRIQDMPAPAAVP